MLLHPDHRSHARLPLTVTAIAALTLVLFWLLPPLTFALNPNSYAWLHAALEAFSISVAGLIFAIGWSAPRDRVPRIVALLACSFLGIAILDFSHTMVFPGMPGYTVPGDVQTAIGFWFAARGLGVAALLAAAWLPWNNAPFKHRHWLVAGILALVVLTHAVVLLYPDALPIFYTAASGLTPVKIRLEWVLIGGYALAALQFARHLRKPRRFNAASLFASAALMVMSELCLSLYSSPIDRYNLVGHIYKVLAYVFLYHALFVETIQAPYQQLKSSQAQLRQALHDKEKQEQTLRKLSLAVEQSPKPMLITNRNGAIEYVNQAFISTSGYELKDILGKNPSFLQSGKTPNATYQAMWSRLSNGLPWQGEVINRRKNGNDYIERILIYPIKNDRGQVTHYLSHKDDITEEKAAAERIRMLSQFDTVTGLPNQTSMRSMLRHAIDLAQHHKDALTLISVNLDNFRVINENLGHPAGDVILKQVGERLAELTSDKDTVARVSGDHFVLILPGLDQTGATVKAAQINAAMQAPFLVEHHPVITTASVGIALYPDDGKTANVLLACSEAAMFHAKHEGRNTYRFFTPALQKSSSRMLALSVALQTAISRQQLYLVYQPQIDLASGRVSGAEALVRWNHPELGEISPVEFIPVAEHYGLIEELGQWILETALKQTRTWSQAGMADLVVAVNLSASQFNTPLLSQRILAAVERIGTNPHQLELELTEAVTMRDPESASQIMHSLRQNGFHLSIDDFGTGYSSLSYLRKFNVDKLKIDRSFIIDLANNPNDQSIVSAIIQMAHSLGMVTLAEGVETAEQLAALRGKGCDQIQGYYFSRPLHAQEFETFVRQHHG
jgi:diguanylate cyclase (GGDEF)-like protein/PAS domain S-box-containing protein